MREMLTKNIGEAWFLTYQTDRKTQIRHGLCQSLNAYRWFHPLPVRVQNGATSIKGYKTRVEKFQKHLKDGNYMGWWICSLA